MCIYVFDFEMACVLYALMLNFLKDWFVKHIKGSDIKTDGLLKGRFWVFLMCLLDGKSHAGNCSDLILFVITRVTMLLSFSLLYSI